MSNQNTPEMSRDAMIAMLKRMADAYCSETMYWALIELERQQAEIERLTTKIERLRDALVQARKHNGAALSLLTPQWMTPEMIESCKNTLGVDYDERDCQTTLFKAVMRSQSDMFHALNDAQKALEENR